jgi:hypothetical protein
MDTGRRVIHCICLATSCCLPSGSQISGLIAPSQNACFAALTNKTENASHSAHVVQEKSGLLAGDAARLTGNGGITT